MEDWKGVKEGVCCDEWVDDVVWRFLIVDVVAIQTYQHIHHL